MSKTLIFQCEYNLKYIMLVSKFYFLLEDDIKLNFYIYWDITGEKLDINQTQVQTVFFIYILIDKYCREFK